MADVKRRAFARHFDSPVDRTWPAPTDTAPIHDATAKKGFDDPVPFLRVTAAELEAKRRRPGGGADQRS
jgi:hypothetical protein